MESLRPHARDRADTQRPYRSYAIHPADWSLPHQMNERLLTAIAAKSGQAAFHQNDQYAGGIASYALIAVWLEP